MVHAHEQVAAARQNTAVVVAVVAVVAAAVAAASDGGDDTDVDSGEDPTHCSASAAAPAPSAASPPAAAAAKAGAAVQALQPLALQLFDPSSSSMWSAPKKRGRGRSCGAFWQLARIAEWSGGVKKTGRRVSGVIPRSRKRSKVVGGRQWKKVCWCGRVKRKAMGVCLCVCVFVCVRGMCTCV